jgi:ketosteroid isomerase-like protein
MSGLTATFEWLDHQILTMIVDGSNAAVHWRARIRVMPSGEEVETELVDVLTIDAGKIRSMTEFCDTALAARLMGADMGRPAGAMA